MNPPSNKMPDEIRNCDRCGKKNVLVHKFCNGEYWICIGCSNKWFKIIEKIGGWSQSIFDKWRVGKYKYNDEKKEVVQFD